MKSPISAMSRDKVRGMMVGTGIGDALGMPLEGFPRSRILSEHPDGLKEYISGDGHKHWNGTPAGTTTDDTGFTKAVMRSIIEADGLDLDSQAVHHVGVYDMVGGMGKSTREAIRRLCNGAHWKRSGQTSVAKRGTGNGVVMKLGPVAAYMAVRPSEPLHQKIVELSAMTHYTQISAIASVVHVNVVFHCFTKAHGSVAGMRPYMVNYDLVDEAAALSQPELFTNDSMARYDVSYLNKVEDDISIPFQHLCKVREYDLSDAQLDETFHNGNCYYLYYNMPFAYAHFIRNPFSIESLYQIVVAGGDTDSNASIVGGMLGALNGLSIFPDHLKEGLLDYQELMELADAFCDKFGVNG